MMNYDERDPHGVPTGSVPKGPYPRGGTIATEGAIPAPASFVQVGGSHYSKHKIQPWAAMEAWMSPEEFKGYLRGNVVKYIARCNDKGGREDILKAKHYIEKLLEVYL